VFQCIAVRCSVLQCVAVRALQCVAVVSCYGVAMISELLEIFNLFCRISSFLKGYFAKETHNFKEPLIVSTPYPNVVGSLVEGSRSLHWWVSFVSVSILLGLFVRPILK